MTYTQALDFIHSTCWKGSRPGLTRTIELTARLGNPQSSLKFIHVAGTNGKGSTSAMLASILHKAGYRVGLYTSPFILRFNERMQINGLDIPDEELAEITNFVRPHADAMVDTPTEFELITAIALVYFARHRCDYVVLEVGMGGRLDSTNIIDADTVVASVITGIALDHTAVLGDTHEKIAAEKAGIIKTSVPIIFGGLHPAPGESVIPAEAVTCGEVIRAQAARMAAPYVPVDTSRLSAVACDLTGTHFDFGAHRGLQVPLAGLYQPYNAATALTVIEVLQERGLTIPEEAIRTGLASVRWPGRFEILHRHPQPPQCRPDGAAVTDDHHRITGDDACQPRGFEHNAGHQQFQPYQQCDRRNAA